MGKMRFVDIFAVREQRVDVVTDDMASFLDATVVAIGGLVRRLQHLGRRVVEEGNDVGVEHRLIGLQRQEVVAAASDDLLRDIDLPWRRW